MGERVGHWGSQRVIRGGWVIGGEGGTLGERVGYWERGWDIGEEGGSLEERRGEMVSHWRKGCVIGGKGWVIGRAGGSLGERGGSLGTGARVGHCRPAFQRSLDDMAQIASPQSTKVFCHRDFTNGTQVRFVNKFPPELEGKVRCCVSVVEYKI